LRSLMQCSLNIQLCWRHTTHIYSTLKKLVILKIWRGLHSAIRISTSSARMFNIGDSVAVMCI
jgi:hypothetical protein